MLSRDYRYRGLFPAQKLRKAKHANKQEKFKIFRVLILFFSSLSCSDGGPDLHVFIGG